MFSFDLTRDSDNDSMPDWWEIKYGLNPQINDAGVTNDGDEFLNGEEYALGLNPLVNDRITRTIDLSFDAGDRLKSAGTVTYTYDAEGNLKTVGN